jgi:CheY-like chemotaxis protein
MPRVLLVEDNELNRDMLSRRLARKGYEVVVAVDGEEGIEKARSEHPDVVLLDMRLPRVSGWEAARILKTSDRTRDILIIALTADAMDEDRERALRAGCDAYDTKPIDFQKLVTRIESLLQSRDHSSHGPRPLAPGALV